MTSRARSFGPPTSISRPFALTSSGPRIRYSITPVAPLLASEARMRRKWAGEMPRDVM